MHTRPSALVTVAAVNRIGAVAVLHRPEQDLVTEIRLGNIRKIVVDPEHARSAVKTALPVFILGGVSQRRRKIPSGAVDLEQVNPDAVRVPYWYQPNPGRARDVAFVLFDEADTKIRADLITNGRWATSALAPSSACVLTDNDIISANSPLHHPADLLLSTATATATASGARLALATGFDPGTFWSELRRYGTTVVTYTRDTLRPLAQTRERDNPIRLFVGSAMPPDLCDNSTNGFPP